MSYSVVTPEEFAAQLGSAPIQRITWVIGAGVSVASGIPLAGGLADRALLYHYFATQRTTEVQCCHPRSKCLWTFRPDHGSTHHRSDRSGTVSKGEL